MAVGAIRQQAAGDRRRGRGRRGRVQDRRLMDRPPGRLTAPATCPDSRQLLARAPAWATGAAYPGSPPDGSRQAAGAARVQGAGVQGRGRGRPRPGGRIISAGAAGRRGRVHFDGRQGRGAPGQRGRDRAHAYTREHKTRVRPLPLKKFFYSPKGNTWPEKQGYFRTGRFFVLCFSRRKASGPPGTVASPRKKSRKKFLKRA